jgi:hypothetical protein
MAYSCTSSSSLPNALLNLRNNAFRDLEPDLLNDVLVDLPWRGVNEGVEG